MGHRYFLCIAALASLGVACSSDSNGGKDDDSPMSQGGKSGSSGGGPIDNPDPGAGATGNTGPTMEYDNGQIPVDQLDEAPATKLPALPSMEHVVALQGDDSASITFFPIDGAKDYRVYALPDDGDISVSGDEVIVKNGTYRCAGTREAPPASIDDEPPVAGNAINTRVDNVLVANYKRTLPEATLGYVYSNPGEGRVPVYALGESAPNADSTCFFGRWGASRFKRYTTSESERDDLLADYARDDGIAFYVPESATDDTHTVYTDDQLIDTPFRSRFYTVDGPEAEHHPDRKPAFEVLSEAGPGTKPLMRVYYGNQCGFSHDELVMGPEWFNRVRYQGDKSSNFTLLWTGITKPTTLVVEALDAGCPFQGHLSTESTPALDVPFANDIIHHQPWLTLDDMRAAAPNGEVFINGHYAEANRPKAIARSFVAVKPAPHTKMDFLATFPPDGEAEEFTTVPCGADNCYQTWRQQSATFDQMFINAESRATPSEGLFTFGPSLGEWWISYADVAADTNGKYRLTANEKATMNADSFLHVTMEVDGYSTARRYPQILISDVDAPVQFGLEKGHTLIVQPRAVIYGGPDKLGDYPVNYELQICNMRTWDVNNQCPVYDLYHVVKNNEVLRLAPNDELGESASADHRVMFDVFASTSRVYLFLEGKPYGCADLPKSIIQAGPTTVTWGDALYHSSVDHTFSFHTEHMLVEQRRHFDNLGFSSGVPAPTWDEKRLPCAAPIPL